MERAAKLTIILGTNGTGKTTLLSNILTQSSQRALIVTPDAAEWLHYPENDLATPDRYNFSGIERHIFSPYGGSLERIAYFSRGILVFDDCRSYLKAATDERIHDILIRRRQRMIDVFAVGHGFNEVPPVFFTFCSDMFLFRTTDNIARRRDCLQKYDELRAIQARVNTKAKTQPHYNEYIKF